MGEPSTEALVPNPSTDVVPPPTRGAEEGDRELRNLAHDADHYDERGDGSRTPESAPSTPSPTTSAVVVNSPTVDFTPQAVGVRRAPPSSPGALSVATNLSPQARHSSAPSDNLIINHLPADMTESELRRLFQPFGTIVQTKVVKDRKTRKSKGYGFVRFTTIDDATAAMRDVDQHPVRGKTLKVSYANPRTPERQGGNVYVCEAPLGFTDQHLTALFESCGPLINTKILTDKATGEPKGCGFVRFQFGKDAQLALRYFNNVRMFLPPAVLRLPSAVRIPDTVCLRLRITEEPGDRTHHPDVARHTEPIVRRSRRGRGRRRGGRRNRNSERRKSRSAVAAPTAGPVYVPAAPMHYAGAVPGPQRMVMPEAPHPHAHSLPYAGHPMVSGVYGGQFMAPLPAVAPHHHPMAYGYMVPSTYPGTTFIAPPPPQPFYQPSTAGYPVQLVASHFHHPQAQHATAAPPLPSPGYYASSAPASSAAHSMSSRASATSTSRSRTISVDAEDARSEPSIPSPKEAAAAPATSDVAPAAV